MKTIGLVLQPLDTLFFRGGRPFLPGLPGESSLPPPQALAGLVRTLLLERSGADLRAMRGKKEMRDGFEAAGVPWLAQVAVRGPFLAEDGNCGPEPVVRAPADLLLGDDGIQRLRPLRRPIAGWNPPEAGLLPLWTPGGRPPKERPQFLDWAGLRAYLWGEEIEKDHLRRAEDLFEMEDRTGIEIDAERWAAAESRIYAVRTLRLRRGVTFYGEVEVPEEGEALVPEEAAVPWGGERHYVRLRRVPPVAWPAASGRQQTLVLYTTS